MGWGCGGVLTFMRFVRQDVTPRVVSKPDVVKSAEAEAQEPRDAIDRLFGAPDKISIPERYVPEVDMDNLTPEERKVRLKKAESIRRMLADTAATGMCGGCQWSWRGRWCHSLSNETNETNAMFYFLLSAGDGSEVAADQEKKEREHLLALNQVIARQVMEKSRMVAGV